MNHIFFFCVMKVSKLEADFEAGWLDEHVKRAEVWQTRNIELLRSPPPHMNALLCIG